MTHRESLRPLRVVDTPDLPDPPLASPGRIEVVAGALLPGTRYRVEGWLGAGRSGTVYEATHEELGRPVAIKVLDGALCFGPEPLQALRRDVRAITPLRSPFIVEVLDVLTLYDGRVAIVMERLEGAPLRDELARAPMTPLRLIPVLRQVCQAVAAAHGVGVAHGDLRVDHVFGLRRGGTTGERGERIKVLDFGGAAMLHAAGLASPMDDIQALGSIAYALLCGHPPRAGAKSQGAGTLRWVPPSTQVGSKAAPAGLELIIERCLASDAATRYAGARALEADLCELELELGLVPPGDALEVPDVGRERTRRIERGMARLRRGRRGSRRAGVLVAGALGLGAVGLAVSPLAGPTPAAPRRANVEALEQQATQAAAKALFVYPPVSDPESVTAFTKVMALERLGTEAAEQRAARLRDEFASTLVRLGDEYWSVPGGRPFAVDYYAQALVFAPGHRRARERGGLTFGDLSELRRRAEEADFTSAELEAAEALAALAEPDRAARHDRLERVIERSRRSRRSAVGEARIAQLLAALPNDGVNESPAEHTNSAPTAPDLDVAPSPAQPTAAEAMPSEEALPADPARARALATEGRKALRRGEWTAAGQAFNRALAHDNRCAAALSGLSDLLFERAEYDRAVRYAERAVRVRPARAEYRLKLGDTYVKALRYRDARRQYTRAKELGHPGAEQRIRRLEASLGSP